MKRLLLIIASLSLLSTATFAQGTTRVRSHTRQDGTRVESHRRTRANATRRDNWSTQGNRNPDTGKRGTKKP